jgi:hypothetical protein
VYGSLGSGGVAIANVYEGITSAPIYSNDECTELLETANTSSNVYASLDDFKSAMHDNVSVYASSIPTPTTTSYAASAGVDADAAATLRDSNEVEQPNAGELLTANPEHYRAPVWNRDTWAESGLSTIRAQQSLFSYLSRELTSYLSNIVADANRTGMQVPQLEGDRFACVADW